MESEPPVAMSEERAERPEGLFFGSGLKSGIGIPGRTHRRVRVSKEEGMVGGRFR